MTAAIIHAKPRVAIIGSGLSAAMMASLLSPHCRVSIFERGRRDGHKPADFTFSGHPIGLAPSFYYGLGGTTNLWTGGLIDMLPQEFAPSWPAQVREGLAPHYLEVVEKVYGADAVASWMTRKPLQVAKAAHLTGIYYPRNPFRAKESGLYDGCAMHFGCTVTRIEERGGRVRLTLEGAGALRHDHYDYAIVAAGGANSPVLLQRSGLGGPAAGLSFTDHPMGFVAKLARPRNRALFGTLRAKQHGADNTKAVLKVRDAQTGLWSAFYLRPAANLRFETDPYARSFKFMAETSTIRRYLAALAHVGEREFLYQILENRLNVRLPSPYAYVLVISEQEDQGQGRITLGADGGPHLHWTVSETAQGAITRNLEVLADVLDADLHRPDGPLAPRLFSGAHHSGTCRIAEDPQAGVVDTDLRLHGSERIYVCDGSVLPSTGATNTGLTIGALAHRLAGHLKAEIFPSAWVAMGSRQAA